MIKKYLHKMVFVAALALGLVAPALQVNASALFEDAKTEACKGIQLSGSATGCPVGSEDTLSKTIKTALDIFSVVIGIVAVIMIIIAGFRFITSAGDSGNVQSARNTLIYAIVGLIIVAFAQFIVKFVLTKL